MTDDGRQTVEPAGGGGTAGGGTTGGDVHGRPLLAVARALLAEEPLCDACLGRPLADRGHGLTNAERGRALRVAVSLAHDEPVTDGAGADCWVCEGVCADFAEWAERAADALAGYEFDTYEVGTRVPPLLAENARLLRESAGLPDDAGEPLQRELNREVGKRLGPRIDADVDRERPDVVALLNLERGDVDAQVNPAFVYGRYRKLEREIPQTEWPCRECGGSGTQLGPEGGNVDCEHCGGSGYLYDDSVEGLVAPHVREAMDGEDATFHGAGREDVDARMLGTGRPFVVEVTEPRVRRPDLDAVAAAVEAEAADRVAVDDLRLATHEMVERVKELPASKRYRAAVAFDAPVGAEALAEAVERLSGATIEQYTPERVDHRRAGKTRTRRVYDASATREDARHATVEVHGEGGLYVKELVSGDDGRTEPSLAGVLGVHATVTALDVLAVEGEDEPFDDPDYLLDDPADADPVAADDDA
ncbi:MAG: tRNA pseudouridine(54/55) synthase Pus10 [Halobacteriaceae archaeon]